MRNLNLDPKYLLKRWGPPILLLLFFLAFVIWINQVDKIPLVSREGQTFEKAVVTEIIQDNLMPDGSRVGEQRVMVRMLTGPKEGEELETTSSSGYLFGAGCTVGMHVVVMQSIAGDTVINTVYTQDREMTIYIFAALYLVVLCLVGGKQGLKGALGLVFTFLCILFVYLPLVYRGCSPFWGVPGLLSLLGGGICVHHHHAGHYVSHRRSHQKDGGGHGGHRCRSGDRRVFRHNLQHRLRDFRMECVGY